MQWRNPDSSSNFRDDNKAYRPRGSYRESRDYESYRTENYRGGHNRGDYRDRSSYRDRGSYGDKKTKVFTGTTKATDPYSNMYWKGSELDQCLQQTPGVSQSRLKQKKEEDKRYLTLDLTDKELYWTKQLCDSVYSKPKISREEKWFQTVSKDLDEEMKNFLQSGTIAEPSFKYVVTGGKAFDLMFKTHLSQDWDIIVDQEDAERFIGSFTEASKNFVSKLRVSFKRNKDVRGIDKNTGTKYTLTQFCFVAPHKFCWVDIVVLPVALPPFVLIDNIKVITKEVLLGNIQKLIQDEEADMHKMTQYRKYWEQQYHDKKYNCNRMYEKEPQVLDNLIWQSALQRKTCRKLNRNKERRKIMSQQSDESDVDSTTDSPTG